MAAPQVAMAPVSLLGGPGGTRPLSGLLVVVATVTVGAVAAGHVGVMQARAAARRPVE